MGTAGERSRKTKIISTTSLEPEENKRKPDVHVFESLPRLDLDLKVVRKQLVVQSETGELDAKMSNPFGERRDSKLDAFTSRSGKGGEDGKVSSGSEFGFEVLLRRSNLGPKAVDLELEAKKKKTST
jgi:hypothetical protein